MYQFHKCFSHFALLLATAINIKFPSAKQDGGLRQREMWTIFHITDDEDFSDKSYFRQIMYLRRQHRIIPDVARDKASS